MSTALRAHEYSITALQETEQTLTEAQVTEWLARQLMLEGKSVPLADALGVNIYRRGTVGDTLFLSWNLHIPGEAFSGHSLSEARDEMHAKIQKPKEMAAERRAHAERLLQEAAALEAGA